MTFQLLRASTRDLDTVSALLAEAGAWMNTAHGNQAWQPDGFPAGRILPGLVEGTVWLLLTGDGVAVATFALDAHPDPEFTSSEAAAVGLTQQLPGALILHRMAATRDPAHRGTGLGPLMVDIATDLTWRSGRDWLLLNSAREHADGLWRLYAETCEHVVTVTSTGRRSGALWRRRATPQPEACAKVTETAR